MEHRFVDFIPNEIEDGVLYVSLIYGTVIHSCACGCGNEVNTPLSATGWKMIYNGEVISLEPSIGNWSFDCKSHYWITNSEIVWSSTWGDKRIKEVRESESIEMIEFYKDKSPDKANINVVKSCKKNWFQRFFNWK